MNAFLEDVERICPVEQWWVSVQECLGEAAREIAEQTAANGAIFGAAQLAKVYGGVYQTIDGTFVGIRRGEEVCRLVAVDSSYWEVSGSLDLEAHMQRKYGSYEPAGA